MLPFLEIIIFTLSDIVIYVSEWQNARISIIFMPLRNSDKNSSHKGHDCHNLNLNEN